MNICEVKSAIREGKFDDIFNMLYGDVTTARERYFKALESFEELYPNLQ